MKNLKTIIITVLIYNLQFTIYNLKAQTYISTASEVSFFSKALLENIEAMNKGSRSLINTETNEIAVIIGIRQFHFHKELMEEHFNENYMESDKFKTASFKGTINEKLDYKKDGTTAVTAKGKLTIHGVEKEVLLNGTLIVKGNILTLNSKFKVALKDYNIKIPTTVISNIAEEIEVTVNIIYEVKK